MIWTPRTFAHNFDGIWSWDGPAASTATYVVTMTQTYSGNQDMVAGLISFKGTSIHFVQAAAAASPQNVFVDGFTMAFPAATTPGNAIVVDLFMLNGNPDHFEVTDTQGNTYHRIFELNPIFTGNQFASFYTTGIVGGANLISIVVKPPTNPGDILDWAAAIHEYSGFDSSPVDAFGTGHVEVQPDVSTVTASAAAAAGELLHAFVATHSFHAGPMTIETISPLDLAGQVSGTFRGFVGGGQIGGGTK